MPAVDVGRGGGEDVIVVVVAGDDAVAPFGSSDAPLMLGVFDSIAARG